VVAVSAIVDLAAVIQTMASSSARINEDDMASRRTRSATRTQTAVQMAPAPPLDVIHGIRLEVTGTEVAVRLEQRIRWHRDRNDALIGQMKKLAEVERDAANEVATTPDRYESPRIVLEKKCVNIRSAHRSCRSCEITS
jgi:hypothetical protein